MKKTIILINTFLIAYENYFRTCKLETMTAIVNELKNHTPSSVIDRFVMCYRVYREGKISINSRVLTECIYSLASFTVSSVLKKIYDASCNETIGKYRREHDLRTLDNLRYCSENATVTRYTAKGEKYTEIIDKDLYNGIKDNIVPFSEKQLMIENIVSYILEWCNKLTLKEIRFCKVNKDGIEKNFVTKLNTYKHPSKHVYVTEFMGLNDVFGGVTDNQKVKDKDGIASVKMVTEKINFIQYLYIKAREYIYSNDSIVALNKNYKYLDATVTDDDGYVIPCYERQLCCTPFTDKIRATDDNTKVYTDKNGVQKIHIVKDAKTDKEIFIDTVEKLKLTDIQKKVLAMRIFYGGAYGYKAIATALHMSNDTVKSALKYIRKKAVDNNIVPATVDYIGIEKTPINTEFELSNNEINRYEYAIALMQYTAPIDSTANGESINRNALNFSIDKDFSTADISIICDLENPIAKTENITNNAVTAYETMTDNELLLHAVYIIENRTDKKAPLCDYWYKNHCEYTIKTVK